MATTLQHRRGSAATAAAFTGAEGEMFLDLDNMILYMHDGTTQGGKAYANYDQLTLDNVTSGGNTTTNDITVGDVTINGDLTVTGTTTTINSTIMEFTDKNIVVGDGSANKAAADGGGLTLDMGSDGYAHINYNATDDGWYTNKSIIPEVDNTYDLGTADKTFRHVFVGPGSLYVNGQQVITDDSGTITVTADEDQNLQFKTAGIGDLQFVTGAGGTITIASTMQITSGYNITDSAGTEINFGDNIEMNGNKITGLAVPTSDADASTKKYVDDNIGAISQTSISDGNSSIAVTDSGTGTAVVTVDGVTALEVTANGVEISGDLIVGGPTTTLQSNALSIFDNIITLNADASGAPTESVGLEVERGDETNVSLRWNESSDTWTFTNDGATYYQVVTSTADLQEVNNLYFTDARARAAISVSGDLSYNSTTGEVSYTDTDTLDTITSRGATTVNAINVGTITTSGALNGPAVFTIDPAAIGDNTGKVVIAGDLQVDGTTTTINSTTLEVTDKNIIVAQGSSDAAAANGAGLTVDLGTSGNATLTYANVADSFNFNKAVYSLGSKVITEDDFGSGNGVDADTLDGEEGTYYLDWTNVTNKPDPTVTLSGAVTGNATMTDLGSINITTTATSDPTLTLSGDCSGSATFTNLGNANLTVTVANDSHTHDGRYYTETEVDDNFLGKTAKAADSNLLDGHDSTYFSVATHNHDADYLGITAKAADADKLDGHDSTYFAVAADVDTSVEVDAKISALVDAAPGTLDTLNELAAALNDDPDFATTVTNQIATKLDASAYTAADVLAKIKTVDGAGSGLDADLLDGHSSTYFSVSTHNHDADYLGITAKAADSDKLDGHDTGYFATATHNHDADYLGITATAAAATKLATARTIALGGDCSGSITFDGTADKTITVVVANDSHTHDGRYFTETEANANFLGKTAKAADSNLLDGHDSTYFAPQASTYNKTEVDNAIANVVDSAPGTLDTLNELAAALNDDPNFATTVTNQIAAKLDASAYTAADVLAKIKTVDGAGSGLDADLLDGHSSTYFSVSTHTHDTRYMRKDTATSHSGDITPTTSDTYDLGSSTYKYAEVHATTFYGTATTAQYADLAEKYTVEGVALPGQVIVIGSEFAECSVADEIASQAVLGVISTNPAFKMNSESDGEYIALKGRVPCKVVGPVAKGEPLVTGPNGCAMGINSIALDLAAKPGIIFGKALESNDEGEATIEVIVL